MNLPDDERKDMEAILTDRGYAAGEFTTSVVEDPLPAHVRSAVHPINATVTVARTSNGRSREYRDEYGQPSWLAAFIDAQRGARPPGARARG